MIRPVRGRLLALVVGIAGLHAGCADKTRALACAGPVAAACAADAMCPATWNDALSDTAICASATATSPLRDDCGAYHVVTVGQTDTVRSYYYDGASGMLVAIVTASGGSRTTTCDAGPAGGFTLPTCAGAGSEPLPQCSDGGVDAIDATAG
jgi:hypothetical protein